jgi:predicted RNase H-like nuclease (RuvC/YqgF family)
MESELSSTEKENNRLSKSNKALSDTFYELSSKIEMLEITIQSIDKNDVYLQVIRPLNQQISDLKKRLKDKEAMEAYLNSEISRLNYEKIDIAINGLYGLR